MPKSTKISWKVVEAGAAPVSAAGGVEELGHEDLLEVRLQQQVGHGLAVDARRGQRLGVGDLQRFDVFQDDDAAGGVTAKDAGDVDARVVGVDFGEALGVVGLGAVVKLLPQCAGKLLHQGRGVGPLANGLVTHQPAGDDTQRGQVGAHQGFDARPLHLDNDALPFATVLRPQPRPVDLAQRGGGQRLALDAGKALLQVTQLLAQQAKDLGVVGRGHFVLQALKLAGDLQRQHVNPRTEKLAQLDHDPAHLDGQTAEFAGDQAQALRPPGHDALVGHGQAPQHQIPPDDVGDNPGEEAQNASIAELIDVGRLVHVKPRF